MKLYLDSSLHLVIGIVGQKFNWISYKSLETKKYARHIHQEIYLSLKEQNFDVEDIEEILQSSGPGSYTGMRLSEGISQVFEWQGIKVSCFYHFEIPQMLGLKEKPWFSKAYKGELFVCRQCEGRFHADLVREEDCSLNKSNAYTYFSTSQMIKDNPERILQKISKKGDRFSPYYYRNAEKEFPLPVKSVNPLINV